eukprot:g2026.t1
MPADGNPGRPAATLAQTPLLKAALVVCHEALRSVQGSAAHPGAANNLCSFVNCPGCRCSPATLQHLEVARVEGLKVLRRKAIEQQKRLVVVFASQEVLEAIALLIGADLSGKVSEVRRLLQQSLVVAYQTLLEPAKVLVQFRLEMEAVPDPGDAGSRCSPERMGRCSVPAAAGAAPAALPERPAERAEVPRLALAHMLKAQELLRELEAGGLRILERSVLAATAPDLLMGPQVCCFLRSAHVITRQKRELCDRLWRALTAFEQVFFVLVLESGLQDQGICEEPTTGLELFQILRAQEHPRKNSLHASTVASEGLATLLVRETLRISATGHGFSIELKEEEPEELPFWAELPGLNAALAEQLLALHRKVPERCGAREVSQILGLRLEEKVIEEMQAALDLKRESTVCRRQEPGKPFSYQLTGTVEKRPTVPPARCGRTVPALAGVAALEDSEVEVQTPQAQRFPAREEMLLTPPDRILAPHRILRTPRATASHPRGDEPQMKRLRGLEMEEEADLKTTRGFRDHVADPSQPRPLRALSAPSPRRAAQMGDPGRLEAGRRRRDLLLPQKRPHSEECEAKADMNRSRLKQHGQSQDGDLGRLEFAHANQFHRSQSSTQSGGLRAAAAPHGCTACSVLRMQSSMDLRFVSLPCVVVASTLQYVRFAKKPMAAPFHRVTERGARRLLWVGLVAELVALGLLPLMQAYPMNASCLVFLYFWKESKRAKVLQLNEVLSCALALAVWILPCLDPTGGVLQPAEVQVDSLLETLWAPGTRPAPSNSFGAERDGTCAYVVILLLLGVAICLLYRGGGNAFVSCLPAALNFGVSSMLLKALPQVARGLLQAPQRLELWAALPVLGGLILAAGSAQTDPTDPTEALPFGARQPEVRSAAASPLRKALEVHDSLRVLAAYGVLSGLAAVLTGGFIYSELAAWKPDRQAIYVALLAGHCWGMRSLSSSDQLRGSPDEPQKAKTEAVEGSSRRQTVLEPAGAPRASVEMTRAAGERGAADVGEKGKEEKGPLLTLEEGAARRRSVDEDARMEEQLFAKALGSLATDSPEAERGTAAPHFDADFEELMRRFDEDDQQQPTTVTERNGAKPVTREVHTVLTLDAEALLDSNANEDEDELLKGIEDLE